MPRTADGDSPAPPVPPGDPRVSDRFRRQSRAGTRPEIELRKALHATGYRFRIQFAIEGLPRRRPDLVFPRRRVAVFVDGCFWHGCPQHFVEPRSNHDWWIEKIAVNRARDRDTDERLHALGWTVIRLWEHQTTTEMVAAVAGVLDSGTSGVVAAAPARDG